MIQPCAVLWGGALLLVITKTTNTNQNVTFRDLMRANNLIFTELFNVTSYTVTRMKSKMSVMPDSSESIVQSHRQAPEAMRRQSPAEHTKKPSSPEIRRFVVSEGKGV